MPVVRADGGMDFRNIGAPTTGARASPYSTTRAEPTAVLLGTTGRMQGSPGPGYLASGLRGSYEGHDGRTSLESVMQRREQQH